MQKAEFEANYRQMVTEQLLELAVQINDLVPDAKTALLAELKIRGISQSDIEAHFSSTKREPAAEHAESVDREQSGEECDSSLIHEKECSFMLKGPVPADWTQIPGFSINDSASLMEYMEANQIPFKITQAPGFGSCRCLLSVPKDRFDNTIHVLKELLGLLDEDPELFTGDCPACGTKLNAAASCSDCGLVLCQNGWDAIAGHPFVKFLKEKGLDRKPA